MSRPRSAAGFFWGLILVGIGLIFLLKNLGVDLPIWSSIATYWPVLLILWGFIKIIDYVRWKKAGEPGPLFGAGEIVLLMIVILSGTVLTAASNLNPDFTRLLEMADIDLWDIAGNSYSYTEHYEMDVTGGSSIEVVNRYGSIEVTPADTDSIIVDVAKTVTAANQEEADELSTVLKFSIVEESGRYRVISNFNRDENRVRGRRFRTSLTIKVPRNSALTVNNRNGVVSVSGLTGDQNIQNGFGDVVVEDISGGTKIKNEFATVEARRITGHVEIENQNGEVEVAEINGDAKIGNSFAAIDARDIQGSLTIDARMSEVRVLNVESNVTIDNQFNSVKVEGAKGEVSVENRNGGVELQYTQPPDHNIRVDSQFGDVTLTLPASSAFSIDARTRFGNVSSDFPELEQRDERERNSLTGRTGVGGPDIRIENRNGNVRVRR